MRIAIVTAWYPSEKNPLYGVFIQNQARALSDHCEVVVLLMSWSLIPFVKERKDGKVTIVERGDFYFPNASERFLNFWASRYVRFFKQMHNKFHFDLIHCHDHYGAFVGDQIKNQVALPYVCTIHNSNIMIDKLAGWKKAYLPRILNNANRVFSVGTKLADVLKTNYGIRDVKVMSNYIDTDRFDIKPVQKNEKFSFLFVGGLESHKGVVELVKAFQMARMDSASLHIIGSGILENEIKTLIADSGMSRDVILYGSIPNEDLPAIYNTSHAYVSVSEYETFGVTVLEAMSCGLPILYTASGGPDELVSPVAGIKIKDRSIESISSGLVEMKESYSNFNGEKIRAHVVSNYGSQSVIQSLLDEYKEVADAKA